MPAFFIWEGNIQAGTHTFQVGHFADILPTVCQIVGIERTATASVDGTSILPVLEGEEIEERTLLWQMDLYKGFQNQGPKPTPYATSVAMHGNMKLLADSLQPVELFNLAQDHREIYNLLGERDSIEQALKQEIKRYHAEPRLECCDYEFMHNASKPDLAIYLNIDKSL